MPTERQVKHVPPGQLVPPRTALHAHHMKKSRRHDEGPDPPGGSGPSSFSSGGQDLNLRPLGYEPSELPSCSTPASLCSNRTTTRRWSFTGLLSPRPHRPPCPKHWTCRPCRPCRRRRSSCRHRRTCRRRTCRRRTCRRRTCRRRRPWTGPRPPAAGRPEGRSGPCRRRPVLLLQGRLALRVRLLRVGDGLLERGVTGGRRLTCVRRLGGVARRLARIGTLGAKTALSASPRLFSKTIFEPYEAATLRSSG